MNATILEILAKVFEVCIIPLLGVLVTYLVKFIQTKRDQLTAETDSELAKKYITMLSDTITSCVIATNQTYVENLKKQGKFDADAQKAAFTLTKDAVLAVLNDDAKKYLTEAYGDLNTYITNQIEASVNQNKSVNE